MEGRVFALKDVDFAPFRDAMRKATYVGKDIMLVHWIIESTNTQTPVHWHTDNEQFGIILQGRAELTVGDERVVLGPGDVYWAPKNVPHGATRVLSDEPLHILDVFSPPRADYLAGADSQPGTSTATRTDD